MVCERITLPSGGAAIVCSSRRRQRCRCGRPATRLCDWKVPTRRSGTCDAPVCSNCSTTPAPDKDLCPPHAEAFASWKARQVENSK
jgi:hypothetical protein